MTVQKLLLYILAISLVSSGSVFAQTQDETVLPNPGITPESRFYFLDKLGEAMREFFTFSPEGKARLQITFAAERIAEIKIILETKGVEARGLAVAQSRLLAHLADAATIVDEQKADGEDVSHLAKELDDEFEGPKSALEEAFKTKKQALRAQEDALKAKIKEARRGAGNAAEVAVLIQQRNEVRAQKELLEQEEDDQEESLEKEEGRISEEMEDGAEAEKKIRKAQREKREAVLDETARGIVLPLSAFDALFEHLSGAESAFAKGKFEEAKYHAEEAKHRAEKVKERLENLDDASDDLEEAKEKEEELKEEHEEKEREAKEGGEGLEKEDGDGEIERLNKEMEKAEEEIKKAEERLREIGSEDEDDR